MRYSRIIIAVVLSTSLIFTAAVSVNATEWTFTPYNLFVQYSAVVQGYDTYWEYHSFNGSNYISNILPESYLDPESDDPTHKVRCLGIQYLNSNNNTGVFEFEEGMIYTFGGEFYVSSSDTNVYDVTFAMSNLAYTDSKSIPNMSIYFTVATRAGRRTVSWEAVVEATEELTSVAFNGYNHISVEFNGSFEGNIRVQNLTCSAMNNYGEDAFYDANISALEDLKAATGEQTLVINEVGENIVESNREVQNAIDNMWQNEYTFVENSMPDTSEGEDQILSDVTEEFNKFSPFFGNIHSLLSSDLSRPCVYLPEVHIPFLNIHVWDPTVLYIDTYLESMNGNIMPLINVVVWFVRFVAAVTFLYVGFYKIAKLDWWVG